MPILTNIIDMIKELIDKYNKEALITEHNRQQIIISNNNRICESKVKRLLDMALVQLPNHYNIERYVMSLKVTNDNTLQGFVSVHDLTKELTRRDLSDITKMINGIIVDINNNYKQILEELFIQLMEEYKVYCEQLYYEYGYVDEVLRVKKINELHNRYNATYNKVYGLTVNVEILSMVKIENNVELTVNVKDSYCICYYIFDNMWNRYFQN